MKTSVWQGCYDENLKSLITPESFAHPAKMAKKLLERIFAYGAEQGYWQPGDVIVDPFGGIGTTGLIGAYRGYHVVSVELEPRFVELHRSNIERNAGKLTRLGKPLPVVIQGDARHAAKLIAQAVGAISSPPYEDQPIEKNSGSIDLEKQYQTYRAQGGGASLESFVRTQQLHSQGYGSSDGQIGALHGGDFDRVVGAVTSPPWEDGLSNDRVDPQERVRLAREMGISNAEHISAIDMEKIGKRQRGYVAGSVTSPPYESSVNQSDNANDGEARLQRKAQAGIDISQAINRGGPNSVLNQAQMYGVTVGQIGNESGETYWQSMAQVYAALYRILRIGGVAAIVVKDFVRNKERVPLCDRTATLLEAVSFIVVERTQAMLVKETHAGIDLFSGEHITKRTERKSFFRRLAESKGSPRIDYEEVIWAQK